MSRAEQAALDQAERLWAAAEELLTLATQQAAETEERVRAEYADELRRLRAELEEATRRADQPDPAARELVETLVAAGRRATLLLEQTMTAVEAAAAGMEAAAREAARERARAEASRAEAERRIAEARAEAEEIVAGARAEVDDLGARRDQILSDLWSLRDAMARATAGLAAADRAGQAQPAPTAP